MFHEPFCDTCVYIGSVVVDGVHYDVYRNCEYWLQGPHHTQYILNFDHDYITTNTPITYGVDITTLEVIK